MHLCDKCDKKVYFTPVSTAAFLEQGKIMPVAL